MRRLGIVVSLVMAAVTNAAETDFTLRVFPPKNPVLPGEAVTLTALGPFEGAATTRFFFTTENTSVLGSAITNTFNLPGGNSVIFAAFDESSFPLVVDRLNLVVVDPLKDKDGDGVNDTVEAVAKTNPADKASTPAPAVKGRFAYCFPTRFGVIAREERPGTDLLGITLKTEFFGTIEGQTFILDIEGIVKSWTMVRKGKGFVGIGASKDDKLTFKGFLAVDDSYVGTFSIKLSKGTFASTLFNSHLFESSPYVSTNAVLGNQLFATRVATPAALVKGRSFKINIKPQQPEETALGRK